MYRLCFCHVLLQLALRSIPEVGLPRAVLLAEVSVTLQCTSIGHIGSVPKLSPTTRREADTGLPGVGTCPFVILLTPTEHLVPPGTQDKTATWEEQRVLPS